MKRIALFQHEVDTQGPGLLTDCLAQHGYTAELFAAGQERPRRAQDFAALIVLGSNHSVHDPEPWIEAELELLRQALWLDIPVLGHCFGAQLLARAMHAPVARNPWPHIGWQHLWVTPAARAFFGGRQRVLSFNWHYDGFGIPQGAQRILFGANCLNKGFRMGRHLALQSHFEVTAADVQAWCAHGDAELACSWGPAAQSRAEILRELTQRTSELHQVSHALYRHWLHTLPRPALVSMLH
ncbi:type 1 glutamine amidotransferase [Roseateles sp. BYS180W]|uniref:Type 1 glutamine amidotransferase n=1 Tax=Roseateles rivi TaxID=3299028 RepID=A0ABW7FXI6_9BURK